MGYAADIIVIIYWKKDQSFVIHRAHHAWFDECNYRLFVEENNNSSYLLLKRDPESLIHNSDILSLIPCDLGITFTPICDTTIHIYEIDLPPYREKWF